MFMSGEEKNFNWKNLYFNSLRWSKRMTFHDENIPIAYLLPHKIISL